MLDIIRDSTFGQILHYFSNGRLASFPEDKGIIPPRYLTTPPSSDSPDGNDKDKNKTATSSARPTESHGGVDSRRSQTPEGGAPFRRQPSLIEAALVRTRPRAATAHDAPGALPAVRESEETMEERFIVGWEGDGDDQDNPKNWSSGKKLFFGFEIALLTFSTYLASALYTAAIPDIIATFHVNHVAALLGLTLYVFAYGVGPLFLCPIQEMPHIGRNLPYLITLFFFILFQAIPPAAGPHLAVLLVFRFLAGIMAGPAISTGGASMTDVFLPHHQAIAIAAWAMGATLGPLLGPAIGGYPCTLEGWRWGFLPTVFLGGFTFIFLFFLLPETYEPTILLRCAQRLRKVTGNPRIRTACEISQISSVSFYSLFVENGKRAILLSFEPAIFVANIHLGLVYSILYLFFESFPLVFIDRHGFDIGQNGLAFLCFLVPAPFTILAYYYYQTLHINPRMSGQGRRPFVPETRLEIGIFAGILIVPALLIFGWTGRNSSVYWICPMVGAALYLPGIFYSFQSVLLYVGTAYPAYAASLFAGNAFWRSSIASVFPLFAKNFFDALGVGGGNTFLAGASLATTGLLYLIYKNGARLRARSSFT